ncbi:MAG: proline dehydrogenase family protein [Planctomycetota bacterium]
MSSKGSSRRSFVARQIESRTQEIGRQLFAAIDTRGPSVFNRQWWDDLVMDWSMADEAVKVQMFRFIDVLPMLDSPDAVAEHLQAYFGDGQAKFPSLVQYGTALAEPGTMRGQLLARAIRQNVTRLARRFIAGNTPAEVLETVKRLRLAGQTFTMDLLGEATITESEADEYLHQYLELLEKLGPEAKRWPEVRTLDRDHAGPIPRVNLSVKVTALYSQFDPVDPSGSARGVGARLREIFRSARRHDAIINLDMEQYAYKDLTIAIFKELLEDREFRDWPNAGIALQAYLPDTERDLLDLRDFANRRGTPFWIRLVKGAYWDYETVIAAQLHWPVPVFTQKWESDASFERCSVLLLESHRALRPAIASHNLRSMAHALAVAEHLELPNGAYELQMLYGMGDQLKAAFLRRGERLRIYTPFGKLLPGMAYLVRRLLENTSNTSFLRATFTEHTSVEELLRPPSGTVREPVEIKMSNHLGSLENLPPFQNEAVLDFSRRIHQEEMYSALERVRGSFGRHYDLWIGGRSLVTPAKLESINPANKQKLGTVARATVENADAAVAAAKEAFSKWRFASVWRRAEVLFETARMLRERRAELAAWEVFECGKQWREADADVAEAIDFCEYYARGALEMSVPRRRSVPGEENYYAYVPRGVTAVISPWNFPLAILCGMSMAPLVMGNTVVIKPAEQSSIVAAKFIEILQALDLPAGVVNFLPGLGEEVGDRLVRHPDVAVITFTGSVKVGLGIQATAADTPPGQRHVKHVIAEMGGKNAILVDEDADMDEAIVGVVRSAFGYQGQKCSACSRVILLPKIHDPFVRRLTDAVASLTIGPPEDPAYAIGPVIDEEACRRLQAAIQRGKEESKCLHAGNVGSLADTGYFIGPHLFGDVAPRSFLAQTELFGPVLAVMKARDLDEALAWANDTDYALTGGLYSRNPLHINKVKQQFEVGNLYINRKITGAEVDRQPFGGFKLSGIGAKAGGPDYLRQFVIPRTVTENTLRRGFAPSEERE